MSLSVKRVTSLLDLSRKAFGKYKRHILVLLILGFFGGFLEGIGINALIPLFSIVLGDGQSGSDKISQAIETLFSFLNIEFDVVYLLVFVAAVFVTRSIIMVYLDYVKIKITADYEIETRNTIFHKVLKSDWMYLINQRLGHLENIVLIDVPYSALILKEISASIMLITSLIVYLLIAVNIDLVITLLTLVLGLILFLILKPLNYKTKNLSYEAVRQNKNVAHHVSENILGIKTIKSMWSTEGVEKKGREYFYKLHDIKINLSVIKSIIGSFMPPVAVIFICFIFAFTYKSTEFNLAALVAIVYLIQKIFTYIQQLQKNLNLMNDKLPYLRSAVEYKEQAIQNEEENSGTKKFMFQNSLEICDVSFAYDNNQKTILNDLNFTVKKGEMIGIIGPSGVGKTTLVDLILRLLKPAKGEIKLDGVNISEIDLQSWRENIGYVSQDMFLINDTVANNIRFYNKEISDEQIVKAAKMANIYEVIEALPEKFETNIGERGVRLSAGQRQRVVIARVLARAPQILVLDEATSALDNESEIQIQKVIESLKGRITVLAIAHRLTTVEDSDRLIVLENGRISEQGSPKELLWKKESYFAKTYNLRK